MVIGLTLHTPGVIVSLGWVQMYIMLADART